ncbi:hypothetical protein TMatcc_002810 [Talaromyces marneffei ATCC 18224]
MFCFSAGRINHPPRHDLPTVAGASSAASDPHCWLRGCVSAPANRCLASATVVDRFYKARGVVTMRICCIIDDAESRHV